MERDNWSLGYLWANCKSATLSPEFDFEPFLSVAWLNNCLRKSQCSRRRTKSLRVTDFTPRAQPSIRSSFVPIPVTIGNVTDRFIRPIRRRYVAPSEIIHWLNALKAVTTAEFITCALGFAIKRLTASWRPQLSQFRSLVILKLQRCGCLGGHTVGTAAGFRLIAAGLSDGSSAAPSKELLAPQRVWNPRNYLVGFCSSMNSTISHEPDPRVELSSLIQSTLGHPVDNKKFAALIAMREALQDRIDQLSDELMERELSPEAYLERLDQTLIEASRQGEDILGYSDFHKVFGELRIEKLGDAKLFLEQYYKGH